MENTSKKIYFTTFTFLILVLLKYAKCSTGSKMTKICTCDSFSTDIKIEYSLSETSKIGCAIHRTIDGTERYFGYRESDRSCVMLNDADVCISHPDCSVPSGSSVADSWGIYEYIACLVVIFLLEAAAGIFGFLNHNRVASTLNDFARKAMLTKYGYSEYQLVTNGINIMQQEFECCGYGKPTDWLVSNYYQDTNTTIVTERGASQMPVSCCKDMNVYGCNLNFDDKNFKEGCLPTLQVWVKQNLMLIGASCIGISMVQLVGIVLAIVLCKKSAEDELTSEAAE